MSTYRVPKCGRHFVKFDDVTIYPVLVVARTVYAARKNLRDKTTANLDLLMPSENKIYISENLTAANREWFKDCLKVKKDLNYRFIWTHYGRIFLRKDSGSPVIMISNRSILDQLRQSTGEMTNVRELSVATSDAATGS